MARRPHAPPPLLIIAAIPGSSIVASLVFRRSPVDPRSSAGAGSREPLPDATHPATSR